MVPASKSPTGRRKAYYFATQKEAAAFVQEVKRGRQAPDPGQQKEQDRYGALVQVALDRLGNDPGQLWQAIEHFEKTRLALPAKTVRQAVEEYQQIRKSIVGPARVQKNREHLRKLFDPFEKKQLADITAADLRRWFDQLRQKINTRSVYSSVSTFFRTAKEYNWIAENPMLGVKPKDKFGVRKESFPVQTFERMLRIAAGLEGPKPGQEPTRRFIDLLPWFVLSGFCGLRSCEAYRLNSERESIRWTDLYWDRGFVHIRAEVAKQTKRESDERWIERPHALAAARSWLELVTPQGDYVTRWTKRKIYELKRQFKATTGIRLVENGLRNSFASYALTYTGLEGVGKLALEMGNSEQIAKRHYIKTLEPGSGKAWFGLRPFAPANVIAISSAVA